MNPLAFFLDTLYFHFMFNIQSVSKEMEPNHKTARGREKSNGDPEIMQVASLKSVQRGTMIVVRHMFGCIMSGRRVNERTKNVFSTEATLFYFEILFFKSTLVCLH